MRDLAIIGGGPVGLAAALAAAREGLSSLVVEARRESAHDPRVFALSYGARLILERLGVWRHVEASYPIRTVHVSQRGRFGRTVLEADQLGIEALGYVSPYAELARALRERALEAGVEIISGARVTALEPQAEAVGVHFEQTGQARARYARIVAQADGGGGLLGDAAATERDYGQCAVVAEVACERAGSAHAYERFTGRGPIALLPLNARHALIWTVDSMQAEALLALDSPSFANALMHAYGERIGRVTALTERASFKLVLRYAHMPVTDRHVLIGNAAQTLHPVAGQGFNLGLRDAFELALALGQSPVRTRDPLHGLRRYRASRRFDRAGGALFTDFLVRAFSNDDPLLALGRSAGLFMLDAAGPAKRFLMRRMIFGSPV